MKYRDTLYTRQRFLEQHNLPNTPATNLRYLAKHPIVALDRALMPLYEWIQMHTKSYGIVTYCAVKK